MAVIRRGSLVRDDWHHADAPDGFDYDGPIFASLADWRSSFRRLTARNRPTGLRLQNDEAPEDAEDLLALVDAIALEFPKFTDGRAYSQARILRDRYDYKGEIRACGEVLPDQVLLMARCGFDTFELPDNAREDTYLQAFETFGVFFQSASDGRWPAARLRGRRHQEKAS